MSCVMPLQKYFVFAIATLTQRKHTGYLGGNILTNNYSFMQAIDLCFLDQA